MDFDYIEDLVLKCKANDTASKEALLDFFKPMIINTSKRYHIDGYELEDLINECYSAVLTAASKYKIGSYSFVGYAKMSIINCFKTLIRNAERKKIVNGSQNLICHEVLEGCIFDDIDVEETAIQNDIKRFLKSHIDNLSPEDRELVHFVYVKNNSIRAFALKKNIKYYIAFSQNKKILQDMRICLKG